MDKTCTLGLLDLLCHVLTKSQHDTHPSVAAVIGSDIPRIRDALKDRTWTDEETISILRVTPLDSLEPVIQESVARMLQVFLDSGRNQPTLAQTPRAVQIWASTLFWKHLQHLFRSLPGADDALVYDVLGDMFDKPVLWIIKDQTISPQERPHVVSDLLIAVGTFSCRLSQTASDKAKRLFHQLLSCGADVQEQAHVHWIFLETLSGTLEYLLSSDREDGKMDQEKACELLETLSDLRTAGYANDSCWQAIARSVYDGTRKLSQKVIAVLLLHHV